MAIHDLYSHRKRISEGKMPDVYVYDRIPGPLRNQIIHIWNRCIDPAGWNYIEREVACDHGLLRLSDGLHYEDPESDCDPKKACKLYLLDQSISFDHIVDIIEFSFNYILKRFESSPILSEIDDPIRELNERFHRAGVGYQFEEDRIIRIDSEFIHTELVKPVLLFLQQPGFEGPREEYLQAHSHYRKGELEAAITEANKAFESTLKVICDERGWNHQKATASILINTVIQNGLLPDYLGQNFIQLHSTLKSGLPKIRNELGAHGRGAQPRQTPDYVAAFALHLAASNIQFLVQAYMDLKSK